MKKNIKLREQAYKIYEQEGQFALYDWANKKGLPYTYCKECDTDIPYAKVDGKFECLTCGSPVKKEEE